jgi:hypothetical protein
MTFDEFFGAVGEAWCHRLIECCGVTPDRFDYDKCYQGIVTGYGPDFIFLYLRNYTGTGDPDASRLPPTLFFDPNTATQCASLQRTRSCGPADGVERRNIYATCMNAAQGTRFEGQSCLTSQECVNGLYCEPGDAGSAACKPISGSGQPCDDPNGNSDRCAYLGIHSATSLHCSNFFATGTCEPGLANGTACNNDQECASGVCSLLNFTCVPSQPIYPGPFACDQYIIPDDAGGD